MFLSPVLDEDSLGRFLIVVTVLFALYAMLVMLTLQMTAAVWFQGVSVETMAPPMAGSNTSSLKLRFLQTPTTSLCSLLGPGQQANTLRNGRNSPSRSRVCIQYLKRPDTYFYRLAGTGGERNRPVDDL